MPTSDPIKSTSPPAGLWFFPLPIPIIPQSPPSATPYCSSSSSSASSSPKSSESSSATSSSSKSKTTNKPTTTKPTKSCPKMATTGSSRSMFMNPPGSPDSPPPFPSPYFMNYFFPRPGWPSPYGGGPYVAPSGMYAAPYSAPYPGFFPPPNALMPPEDAPSEVGSPSTTSTALVRIQPVRRDTTPASYPTPPVDDPENPPIPIHPYLYNVDCPVEWDLRTNFRHSARRAGGVERLSSIALKAPAFNDSAVEDPDKYKTMRIIFAEESVPWTITFTKERHITVQEVLDEIAHGLDVHMTDAEVVIAQERQEERYSKAEEARAANIGTGSVKPRPAGDSMRRVDWLARKTRFRGFVHSSAKEYEELVQRRVHAHSRANTWIMVLEDRPEEETPPGEGALVVAA